CIDQSLSNSAISCSNRCCSFFFHAAVCVSPCFVFALLTFSLFCSAYSLFSVAAFFFCGKLGLASTPPFGAALLGCLSLCFGAGVASRSAISSSSFLISVCLEACT